VETIASGGAKQQRRKKMIFVLHEAQGKQKIF
jgi:hypothetical protein